jgi:hypothetical protein
MSQNPRPNRRNPNINPNIVPGGTTPRGITSSYQVHGSVDKIISARSVSARAQSRANFSMNKIDGNRNSKTNPFTTPFRGMTVRKPQP